MALTADAGSSWVIIFDGVVIGDCGALQWPDEDGVVEVGYGLAEPFRGQGYATEAAEAVCPWLFSEALATAIIATGIDGDNVASRRVLEKLGFAQIDQNEPYVSYRFERHKMARGEAPLPRRRNHRGTWTTARVRQVAVAVIRAGSTPTDSGLVGRPQRTCRWASVWVVCLAEGS